MPCVLCKLVSLYRDAMRYRWLRRYVRENEGRLRLCLTFDNSKRGWTFEEHVDNQRRWLKANGHGIARGPGCCGGASGGLITAEQAMRAGRAIAGDRHE
jgi:hypothetical protein